jgi:hypothetical protein
VNRTALLSFALMTATPALACQDGAISLYSCSVGEHYDEGSIEFCDLTGGGADTDRLQFELVFGGKQFRYPTDASQSRQQFFFSHSNGPGGYLVNMRFADGDTKYRVYSLDIPPDPADENDAGGGAAGVVITQADGSAEVISCGDRPYEFITYLQRSMSCDLTNPMGEAGCDEDHTAERTEPLKDDHGAPDF